MTPKLTVVHRKRVSDEADTSPGCPLFITVFSFKPPFLVKYFCVEKIEKIEKIEYGIQGSNL